MNVINKLSKDKLIKFLPLVAVALVILIICIIVNANKINIKDYVTDSIKFRGYNGYATVLTDKSNIIDTDSLLEDLGYAPEDISQAFMTEFTVEDAIDVDYVGGEPENLKNGDEITYLITVDYDLINDCDFKKKLKGKEEFEKVYKVEGLEEPTMIDPFEAIDKVVVQYDSYSEEYECKIQYLEESYGYTVKQSYIDRCYDLKKEDETFASVTFAVPEIKKINDGDQITITLSSETDQYIEKGIIFSETSKEFKVLTCKDLKSRDEITETSYNKLKKLFDEETADKNGQCQFAEMYFYSDKSSYSDSISNSIIAIYKYQSDAIGSETEYFYLTLENPIISSDGEIVTFNGNVHINESYNEYDSLSELKKELSSDQDGFFSSTKVLAFDKISF